MRIINKIILHCTDTPGDVDIHEVRRWHVEERGFSDVGYHFLVRTNGAIEFGRHMQVPGAHAKGHNQNSIGVAYAGGAGGVDTRTVDQFKTLFYLVKTLKIMFPEAEVLGHRDLPGVTKTCPSFDAKKEYE